jgi:hypothetical protein
MSFSLQEVDVTLPPVILVAKGIRAVPVLEVGGRRLDGNATQRATRRPDLRSGSLSVRGLFSSAMRLQPVLLRDIGGI